MRRAAAFFATCQGFASWATVVPDKGWKAAAIDSIGPCNCAREDAVGPILVGQFPKHLNDQFLPLERHYGMSGYAVVCTFVYLVIRRMFQKFSEHTFQALESLDPTFPAVHQRQQEMLAGLPSAFGTRWLAVLQRGWHNSIGLYSVVWECMRRSKVESCRTVVLAGGFKCVLYRSFFKIYLLCSSPMTHWDFPIRWIEHD